MIVNHRTGNIKTNLKRLSESHSRIKSVAISSYNHNLSGGSCFGDKYGISNPIVLNEINPLIGKVAAEESLLCIDLYTPLLDYKNHFPDGVIPMLRVLQRWQQ